MDKKTKHQWHFDPYILLHSMGVSAALLVALITHYFFSFTHQYWLLLATFFVGLTTRGTPLQQSLKLFLTMIVAVISGTILQFYAPIFYLELIVGAVFLALGVTFFAQLFDASLRNKLLIFMIMFLLPLAHMRTQTLYLTLHDRLFDLAVGAIIGILIPQLFFRTRIVKEFCRGVLPLLEALEAYANATVESLKRAENQSLVAQKTKLEAAFYGVHQAFPEWVYETGFNPGLRAGFRFFLLKLEWMLEIFSAMHGLLLTQDHDEKWLALHVEMAQVMAKNVELFALLQAYFRKQTLLKTEANLMQDVVQLEATLQKNIPSDLELLDISKDYLRQTELVKEVKEIRDILLQLMMSLPEIPAKNRLKQNISN